MENSILDNYLRKRKEELDDEIRKCNIRYDKTMNEYRYKIENVNQKNTGASGSIIIGIMLIPILFLVMCSITCFTNCDAWSDVLFFGKTDEPMDSIMGRCMLIAFAIGFIIIVIAIVKVVINMRSSSGIEKMINQLKNEQQEEINKLYEKYNQDVVNIQANYCMTIRKAKEVFLISKNTEKLLEEVYVRFHQIMELQDTSEHIRYLEFHIAFVIEKNRIHISVIDDKFETIEFQRLLIKDLKTSEECEALAEVIVSKLKVRIVVEIPKSECNYTKMGFNGYRVFFKCPNINYIGMDSW